MLGRLHSYIAAFDSVLLRKADNRDFFSWEIDANGMLAPNSLAFGQGLDELSYPILNFSPLPASPVLAVSTSGMMLNLSWDLVNEAASYTLYYAPYPFEGADTIRQIEVGTDTHFSATLWEGASFYVALTASNEGGESEYSNIERFTILAQ